MAQKGTGDPSAKAQSRRSNTRSDDSAVVNGPERNGFTTSAEKPLGYLNNGSGLSGKENNSGFKIDKKRWRLRDIEGVQTWHYMYDDKTAAAWPQTLADKYFLGLPMNRPSLPKPKTAIDSVKNCLEFFQHLQLEPGNWGSEYGGPMFLLPGVVYSWIATETPIPEAHRIEMINYLFARQHPVDGGWGLHVEGHSSVLGTAMNYVAIRLLGASRDDPRIIKARATLHRLGGAVKGPHWTKFWLCALGLAKWDICNPVPPELWLIPDWVPIAPWKWWIHMRMVFLSMSYVWSKGWQYKTTPIIEELREEIYTEPYESINWGAYRNTVAHTDDLYPKSWLLKLLMWILVWIWIPLLRPNFLVKRAEEWVWKLTVMEDENTDYADLASVNAPMIFLCRYIREGPDAYSVRRHRERLEELLWVNHEGMLVNGTNGVQIWDTAFFIQALIGTDLEYDPKWRPVLNKALEFLEDQQIRENVKDQAICYRQQRKGGWAFSNKTQGYAVSDCISEALKSVLYLQHTPGYPVVLSDQRIFDAIDTLLTYQNPSGGCASYEPTRGSELLELLNASEIFGRVMVEYDYPECTTAVVTALSLFTKHYPNYRTEDIKKFKDRAIKYIRRAQYPDGRWYGSWGICFTYAGMFALESLASIGENYNNSKHVKKGCDYFISKQRSDGGWSESYKACEQMEWVEHSDGSQVVQTAWACIGLLEAKYPDREPIEKAMKFLMSRQQPSGEWLQEAIEGVFNKSTMITYQNYKFIFPMMALGKFHQMYGDIVLQ